MRVYQKNQLPRYPAECVLFKKIKPTFVVKAVVDMGSPVYYWLAFNRRGYAFFCRIPSSIAYGLCHTANIHLSGIRSSYFPYPGTAFVITGTVHGQPHHQT